MSVRLLQGTQYLRDLNMIHLLGSRNFGDLISAPKGEDEEPQKTEKRGCDDGRRDAEVFFRIDLCNKLKM